MMSLLCLVPAYNEDRNLPSLFERTLRDVVPLAPVRQLVVVNDGSVDRTREVALEWGRRLPLTVLDHPTNLGPGAAFRTGFAHAVSLLEDDDFLLTIEADGSSDLALLPRMLENMHPDVAVCVASCYAPGGSLRNVPSARRVLSRFANSMLRYGLGMTEIRTWTSFYRLYRGSAVKAAMRKYGDRFIEEDGFIAAAEILYKFRRLGMRVVEIPCSVDWGTGPRRNSRMRVFRTIRGHLSFIARAFWARLT